LKANNLIYQYLIFSLFFVVLNKNISAQDLNQIDVGLEINSLTRDMDSAISDQLDVLSPENFAKANTSLQNARVDLEKQMELKREAHYQVTQAQNFLANALATSTVAKKEINDVVIARQSAIAAGAPRFFPKDFKKADEELLKTTKALEKDNSANTEGSRLPLRVSYYDLELRSIRHENLAPAGVAILQAIKEGAKQYAPARLEEVLSNYHEVSDYIRDNRTNVNEIRARSTAVVENANQLLRTTRTIAEAQSPRREDVVTTRQASAESLNADAQVKRMQSQFKASEADVLPRWEYMFICACVA
jgi:OOP family OmpA-OmpF porin